MCKERDVLQFIAGKSKDVDPGVNVTQPENMVEPEEETRVQRPRRKVANYGISQDGRETSHGGKRKIVSLLQAIFAISAGLETNVQELPLQGSYESMPLDYEAMKRKKPATATHALLDGDWFLWYKAFQSEHNGWIDGQVVLPIPKSERIKGCKTIHCRVVLERKWDKATGAFIKNKLRCAVRGDQLRKGIDYKETFSPTAGAFAIRMVAMVASRSGKLSRRRKFQFRQSDAKQAYLNSQIENVYYVYIPSYAKYAEMSLSEITKERQRLRRLKQDDVRAFEKEARQVSDHNSDYVWLARSQAYGGPDAGRSWYFMLVAILVDDLGFQQSKYEPCLFWIGNVADISDDSEWLLLVVWVDDCLYVGTDKAVEWFVTEFQKHAKFGDEGEASAFVGLAFEYDADKGHTKISCPILIDKLVRNASDYLKGKYNRKTPAREGRIYTRATDEEYAEARHLPFPSIIGACLFASNWCRPDITAAIAMLSCHMTKWSKDIFDGALDVVMYLRATRNEGIAFGRANEPHDVLVAWADSDLGKDETRRPRTGWVIKCGGGPIDWSSNLQQNNLDDVTSAELKAAAKGAKKTRMVYNVMSEIGGGLRPKMVPIMFGDNAAAVQVNNNMGALGSRVRHLELSHFMTRDMVMPGMLVYLWCESAKMRADMFTKNLGRILFCRLRTAACGYNYNEESSAVEGTVDSAGGAPVSRGSSSGAGREGAGGTN